MKQQLKRMWVATFPRNQNCNPKQIKMNLTHWGSFTEVEKVSTSPDQVQIWMTTHYEASMACVKKVMIDKFIQWKRENDKL